MKFSRYTTTLFLTATLFSIGGCEKDETRLSEAVLASASALNFEGNGATEQIITVYADAEWISEVPEWVTISPTSGNGVMDVTISVSDNMRGGALDNPRKATVVFKGRTLASRAEVLIQQAGDKFRDGKEYTIGELDALDNEAVVTVPNITVITITSAGFIATDGQNNVYVLSSSTVSIGDKVTVMGSKSSNAQSLTIVEADRIETLSTGGTVTYPAATDISNQLDTYNPGSRQFIEVNGVVSGNKIMVEGATYSVSITDIPASIDFTALNAHSVTVKGFFDGVAAPAVKIILAELTDNGLFKLIYFSENFEWLNPWSLAGNAGQTVETDNLSASAPQIPTPKVDGVSSLDALLTKGYEFLRVTPASDNASECVYLQQNYLKFGKTGYQAGIVFPKITNIPSGVTAVLAFDWCPMRQGSGVIDPVNLLVIVANGSSEVEFNIPPSGWASGHKLEWIRAEIELTGVAITEDTKITLRQTNWKLSTANRWFLDNIEISKAN
ncbi:MAG: BACON domain-containing protein [Dysgonamonadaceae bacterium]|nr:BACON domain-containing protein [Dysgonamonadaceae bacterium]